MRFEKFLALHASAGSGKTYALSVRYISLLFLGAQPSKILALTFTNKAASEMKTRIFETLLHLESKNELNDIALQVGLSKEEILERKEEVLNRFLNEELMISTLDSFFASILRKFALHAGLMPDFGIESSLLDKGILEKFLRVCIQEKKYKSLIEFALVEDHKLSSVFTLLDSFYAKEGEFDATLFPKATFSSPKKALDCACELQSMLEKVGAAPRAVSLFAFDEITDMIGKGVFEKPSLAEHSYTKKYASNECEEKFSELKSELNAYLEARERFILGELGELYSLYKNSLRSLNQNLGLLSFSDVAVIIYTLLQNEISREFLYFRLDGKIDHILIDEYQDTNVLQYNILYPLIEEIISGVGTKEFKSFFFVGDVKQSIYRFRGGSKELFEHTLREFGVKRDILDTNYRSRKNVVHFVNETFKTLIKGYEVQKVKSEKDGFVKVVFNDELEKSIIESVNLLLDAGAKFRDIAFLVHKNDDATLIKELLIEHIEDVKVQTEASIKLIDVPIIMAILNFIKYLYFQDELYYKNFLTLIGRDYRNKAEQFSFDLALSPLKIIKQIVKTFEIFEDDMDVVKLLELSNRYTDIESFIFASESFSEEAKSEDNDGIKILTIHKSKGLEFEHVIVVDRFSNPNNKKSTFLFEYDDIKLQAIFHRVSKREFLDKNYNRAYEKEKLLESEDRLNMYYVAFTRAESSLIICSKEKGSAFVELGLEECEIGKLEIEYKEEKKKTLLKMLESKQNFGVQEKLKNQESSGVENYFAIEYGLALHYGLELMRDFTKNSLEVAYKGMFNRYSKTLSKTVLEEIKSKIELLVEDSFFLTLLEDGVFYKEQPIVYNKERKQLDLLIEKESEVIIVDYKSSHELRDGHLNQIAHYKKALESIYEIPVRAYLCYLGDGVEFKSL